jgi:hypothetical protein
MKLPRAFDLRITLNANSPDCPDEVSYEIADQLWANYELGDNDTTHFEVEDNEEEYPEICKYLKANLIKECYINYGW